MESPSFGRILLESGSHTHCSYGTTKPKTKAKGAEALSLGFGPTEARRKTRISFRLRSDEGSEDSGRSVLRNNFWPVLGLLLLLLLFGGFSWLTHHPDAEILRRAEGWPGIGPYAERFRAAYSAPIVPEQDTFWRPAEKIVIQEPPELKPFVWIEAGRHLRSEPSHNARSLVRTDRLANLSQQERRGDWYRVWSNRHQVEGWVHLPGYLEREPPMGSEPEPPGPLMARRADPDELKRALALFKNGDDEGYETLALGPYTLYTNVQKPSLFRDMELIAKQLDSVYTQRYGRRPLGKPAESVVLYAEESTYRAVQQGSRHLHGLNATGHTGNGMVLFYVGKRNLHEVRSTFIHELGHLLNRRAIGPALPPWLDEGLADDLSNGLWRDGRLDPSTLGGFRLNWGDHLSFQGGWAALLHLENAIEDRKIPDLDDLMSTDWQSFMDGDSRLSYDTSALFIRYLLGSPDAPAFKAFLDEVADGQPLTPELLRRRLQRPWSTIEADYRRWLISEARSLRANPP